MVELRPQSVMVDYVHIGMQCGCTRNLANTSTRLSCDRVIKRALGNLSSQARW